MVKQHKENRGFFSPPVIEKVGVKEWLPIRQHSRMLYLKLRPEDIRLYDFQQEDVLLVQIVAHRIMPRDPDKQEQEK